MAKPEGTINGKTYPIAVNENGQVLWHTVEVASEKDEVWDDWSLGMGEDYYFAKGFDGSTKNVLRLSPFYHALNNPTDHSTAYGYPMEEPGSVPETITYDNADSVTGTGVATVTISSFAVASGNNRILMVGLSSKDGTTAMPHSNGTMTFDGQPLSVLVALLYGSPGKRCSIWYLTNPPVTTADVVWTAASGIANIVMGATSYSGVDGNDPFGSAVSASGTDQTPTVDTVSAAGEEVFDVLIADNPTTCTDDAGTSAQRWNTNVTSSTRGGASDEDGAASVTSSWALGSSVAWAICAVPLKPGTTTGGQYFFYWADGPKITEYTYDSSGGITDSNSQTIAGGTAGRPAKFLGKWYAPMGAGANAYRLDSPGTGTRWVDSGFKASHLCTFQQGVTPLLVKADDANTNELDSVATAPTADGDFAAFGKAGDTTTKITDLVESSGQLYVATEDNLYEFGLEGDARPVIPFLNRGNVDPDNGKGTHAFGDVIIYPCSQGLWRYQIGRGALPVGLESLRGFPYTSLVFGEYAAPKGRRPAFVVSVGEWWYVLQNSATQSLLLQMRQRREGDPGGHEMIIHGVLEVPLSKGLGPDRNNNLWIKGASLALSDRDIRVIELDEHGGLDMITRRGQPSADHNIYFDERNPGRPQDKVQLRHFTVDLSGWGWHATKCYLQRKIWRDNDASPGDVGDTLGSAGVSTANWTVGTADTCYRFRPQLLVTTSSAYAPRRLTDPQTLKVIVGIRFPEIIEIVVPADDALLKSYGKTAIDAEQNLRRLQNQGVVAFGRPEGLGEGAITTFNAEVTGVTDVMYQNSQGVYCHGLQLVVTRWITG